MANKSDAAETFRALLPDVRGDGLPSTVEIVSSDNGGEFQEGDFGDICNELLIKQEFTSAQSPKFNEVAERALHMIDSVGLAARIQAREPFPCCPASNGLSWAEAMHWACDASESHSHYCQFELQGSTRNVARRERSNFTRSVSETRLLPLEPSIQISAKSGGCVVSWTKHQPPT